MFKRIASLFSAAVLIGALITSAVPATPAYAQTAGNNQPSTTDLIMSGLWAGVNLLSWPAALSGGGAPRPTTPSPTPAPATPAPTAPATSGSYVALGDSVAAGVGLPTAAQVPYGQAGCDRTTQAYPYEVSRGMGLPLVHTACSGATVRDMYTTQLAGLSLVPAQLDAAFRSGTPRLITLTAGANDVLWERFLRTCASSLNCANQVSTDLAEARLATVQKRLHYALGQIQSRSGNQPPTVVITGYYNPVSPSCTTVRQTVTANEVRWMTGAVNALNQTIRQVAANYSFVRFAPVNFTGHDICSGQSWIQGLDAASPIHPTAKGQRIIARSILTALGR